MNKVISQTVVLPAPAEELFRMYLDPTAHAAITGAKVDIGPDPGDVFSAFDGALSGRILAVVARKLIVQSWRSTQFNPNDPDSTLILSFSPNGTDGQIDLIHINVPEHDFNGVDEGWKNFYWAPWQEYLKKR